MNKSHWCILGTLAMNLCSVFISNKSNISEGIDLSFTHIPKDTSKQVLQNV